MTKSFISMANLSLKPALFLAILCIFAFATEQAEFGTSLNPKKLGLKKEKLTYFRVYYQEILSGSTPSAIRVVLPPPRNNSQSMFGTVIMLDDNLTVANESRSKLVGRAQGLYGFSANTENGEETVLTMMMNFAFTKGKYNGSTITIMGRNVGADPVREMPIVGGSGVFRFARGYTELRTTALDTTTGDVTVQYDMYVLHYY